jgi:PD-(D/E)XK nuclease superfamily
MANLILCVAGTTLRGHMQKTHAGIFDELAQASAPLHSRLSWYRHNALDADPQQIDRTKQIVERVWEAIQAGIFFPSPSAMQCPACPFRAACRAWTG